MLKGALGTSSLLCDISLSRVPKAVRILSLKASTVVQEGIIKSSLNSSRFFFHLEFLKVIVKLELFLKICWFGFCYQTQVVPDGSVKSSLKLHPILLL